jgi:polysaccharide export outer membrane protein
MKIYSKNLTIFIFLLFLVSSCVTTKKVRYLQDPGCIIPGYEEMLTPDDYKVQILDELYIRVTTLDKDMGELFNLAAGGSNFSVGNANSSSPGFNSYTVTDEGTIIFPFVGEIHVVGQTTREIKKTVTQALSKMLNELSVDVKLMNSYFSILGDAINGRYLITKERLNIFQALSLAGDLEDFSDRAHIKIIRQKPEGAVVYTFDVRSKDIIDSEFYYIQPNDVIYVRAFNGQFFGLSSFTTLFSVVSSIVSLTLIFVRFGNVF